MPLRPWIVLPGKALRLCLVNCLAEFYFQTDLVKYGNSDPPGFVAADDFDDGLRLLRQGLSRPWEKRAEFLAGRASPKVHSLMYHRMSELTVDVVEEERYRINSDWASSLRRGLTEQRMRLEETEPAGDDALLRRIATPPLYIEWVRLGGSPDLVRWLSMFAAGAYDELYGE